MTDSIAFAEWWTQITGQQVHYLRYYRSAVTVCDVMKNERACTYNADSVTCPACQRWLEENEQDGRNDKVD